MSDVLSDVIVGEVLSDRHGVRYLVCSPGMAVRLGADDPGGPTPLANLDRAYGPLTAPLPDAATAAGMLRGQAARLLEEGRAGDRDATARAACLLDAADRLAPQ